MGFQSVDCGEGGNDFAEGPVVYTSCQRRELCVRFPSMKISDNHCVTVVGKILSIT
jgi:hypothetical protein